MSDDKVKTKEMLKTLLSLRPKFHGSEQAGTKHYAIMDEVLQWIFAHLEPGSITLETGCGYSTIVFGLLSKLHIVISPYYQEHDLIKKWCREHQVPIAGIEFMAAQSQDVIHSLDSLNKINRPHPLDMVLIDGDHAFPAPFIDWYYTADRIKQGGYVIVDDTQLITGQILKEFLQAEEKRWALEIEIGKTSIYKKLVSTPVISGIPWIHQPYVNRGLFPLG